MIPSQLSSPFQYLQHLEQILLARASKIPLPQAVVQDAACIVFRINQQIFIAALEEIVEILRVQHLALLPNVKPWLRGLIPCRGEIYPVTDLAAFLTHKLTKITDKTRILITKHQAEYFGLLVDEVIRLERYAKESDLKHKVLALAFFEPYLSGTLIKGAKELPILNLKKLVEHPHLRNVTLRTRMVTDTER